MTKPKKKPKHHPERQPYPKELQSYIEVGETRIYRNGEYFWQPNERELTIAKTTQAERMTLVFDHFNIDRNDPKKWRSVAEAIAAHCIPGVGIILVRRAGQPRKIKGNERQFLDRISELEAAGESHDNARRKAAREFGSTAGLRAVRNMESAARVKVAMLNWRLERYFADDPEFLRSLSLYDHK